MFEDLMKNASGMQDEMKDALTKIHIKEEVNGVSIEGNATREISNISINETLCEIEHKEELEDYLTLAFNKFLNTVSQKEQEASQEMIQKMMPGLGNIFQ